MTTRTARKSTTAIVLAAAALSAPAPAGASTVTGSQSGTVTFRGTSGESADVTINAVSKRSRGRMLQGVVIVDRGTEVLTPKGLCRRGSSPRRVICVTGSPRLRAFRVRFKGEDDILRWKSFDGLRRLSIRAFGGSGNDRLSLPPVGGRLYGGNGDDRLFGGPGGADRLFGGPGNDRLIGFGGGDLLDGEDGNDVLDGGVGPDRLHGGAGDDALTGGGGRDGFNGGLGNDIISTADGVTETALHCGDGQDALVRDGGDGPGTGDCENVTIP